jgi:hypothetical protein
MRQLQIVTFLGLRHCSLLMVHSQVHSAREEAIRADARACRVHLHSALLAPAGCAYYRWKCWTERTQHATRRDRYRTRPDSRAAPVAAALIPVTTDHKIILPVSEEAAKLATAPALKAIIPATTE